MNFDGPVSLKDKTLPSSGTNMITHRYAVGNRKWPFYRVLVSNETLL